jgi:hypothetical protein
MTRSGECCRIRMRKVDASLGCRQVTESHESMARPIREMNGVSRIGLIRLALSQEKLCNRQLQFAYRHEGMIFRNKFVIVIR